VVTSLISQSNVSEASQAFLNEKYDYTVPRTIEYVPQRFPGITSGLTVIVGPSGSGKTQMLSTVPGKASVSAITDDTAVIDHVTPEDSNFLHASGLSSIPQWAKPPKHLSNGEQSRFYLAMTLKYLHKHPHLAMTVDEFTSTVDRVVAHSMCRAITKNAPDWSRHHLILVSCHMDILDWLEPTTVIRTDTQEVDTDPKHADRLNWRASFDGEPINLWS
jgi:ABC-type ATPase with predicted acetyltransferase domain